MAELQQTVFDRSLVGRCVQDYLPIVLIRPTAPEDNGLADEHTIYRRREHEVNEVLEKR